MKDIQTKFQQDCFYEKKKENILKFAWSNKQRWLQNDIWKAVVAWLVGVDKQ